MRRRRWPVRRRWVVAVIGRESGNITRLTFARFWTRAAAQSWADQLNDDVHDLGLTSFRPVKD